jgi:hypothetical protein
MTTARVAEPGGSLRDATELGLTHDAVAGALRDFAED